MYYTISVMEKSIDELLNDFNPIQDTSGPVGRTPITFWLPKEYKEKYEFLQERSRRGFSKKLQEVLKRSIDKVYNGLNEAS